MKIPSFAVLLAAILAAATGGCIPSVPISEEQLDRYWYVQSDIWQQARSEPLKLGPRKLPTKWVLRQEPSVIWATVGIIRAVDELKAGADEIDITISPAHADMLADILAEVRQAIENLRTIAHPDQSPSPVLWAETVADTLVTVEDVVRLAAADGQQHTWGDEKANPLGLSAQPVLSMLVGYLNERSGGQLVSSLGEKEGLQLREILTEMVLRVSFAAAGKQDPPGLGESMSELMRQADSQETLKASLGDALLSELADAPPAGPASQLPALVNTVLSWAPRMLEVFESFVRQWDQMESLTIELRRFGNQPIIAVTLNVAPKRELRMKGLFFMQPVFVFHGSTRVVLLPKLPQTQETLVLFEPEGDGAAEVRYEALAYGLVRLLALPLENAAIREVRVAASSNQGRAMVNVEMVMEAVGGKGDPRRLIAFQDVRERRIVRDAFSVQRKTERTEQIFTYLTPTRRYTYSRVKLPSGP